MSSLRSLQRRQMDRDDVQPVEEVLAEPPFLHHLPEIDVGRGDDSHVDLDRLHPAQAHEVAFLDDAQQLRLGLERHVADLVEEDAAAIGEIEEPLLRIDRSGERAFHVPEERRLEEVRRQVAGVDGDERAVRARGIGVNRARDQLLAGAALALDENRRTARRRLDDQVEHLTHLRAAADDVGELVVALLDVLPQRPVLGHQPPPLHGVADDDQHLVVLEGLGDVVERAALHRRNGALDRGIGGDDDHRQVLVDPLQLVERRNPVQARHHDVDDGRVEWQRTRELQSFGAGRSEPYVVAGARQQRLEDFPHDFLVVDDEDGALLRGSHVSFRSGPGRTHGAPPG